VCVCIGCHTWTIDERVMCESWRERVRVRERSG
jgi:hypothetical protein